MYTVTFYSYKGGVGRTMALANVAYALAKAGKRVLVVDFDLEAPGLPSYLNVDGDGVGRGLVDLVHAFIETSAAPAVEDFIATAAIGDQSVWFLPAGQHTRSDYSMKLNEIDWGKLYAEQDGFLFMEDIKRQWEEFRGHGFDYVLIDSRTGHTDIGGICTRQLPDAVIVLFVPTPQNIDGLRPIIRSIVTERAPVRNERVTIHFCPANIPDLDDEEDIVKSLLKEAREKLRYRKSAAVIQHYRSLDLLQHPVYTFIKPNSRLAKQYTHLFTALIAGNLRDREGAVACLDQMTAEFDKAREANDAHAITSINTNIAIIRANFPEDGEVAWKLAALANNMMRPEEEVAALTVAINAGVKATLARLHRAQVLALLGRREEAAADLRQLLLQGMVTTFELSPAIELLMAFDPPGWRTTAEQALSNPCLGASSKAAILLRLLDNRDNAPNVALLAESVLMDDYPDEERSALITSYALALISSGRLQDAMRTIGDAAQEIVASRHMAWVFNYAVAMWGDTGVAPLPLFKRVIALREESKAAAEPNLLQCLALCHMALGQKDEAISALKAAEAITEIEDHHFSCWRYLYVNGAELLRDIAEMSRIASDGKNPEPPFLQ